MKSIVLIQARLSSSRLPAKVLLPIYGIPLVVIAAKRAANTGKDVLVVTSDHQSDDALCDELTRNGLKYFRGSLNNTLERFVSALKSYEDNTIVLRLTADNPVPDGSLLDELEGFFIDQELNYLVCNGEKSGLPYGVSVEIIRLKSLREAIKNTNNVIDLEHVTPYIWRKFGEEYFKKYISLNMGNYRCTVDSFDDYLNVHRLFSNFDSPETVSWLKLVEILKNQEEVALISKPVKKMVLGGAQIGLDYGIKNFTGKPNFRVSEDIVKKAISNGIEYIDTANGYGDSERTLGMILTKGLESRVKTITKLSHLQQFDEDMDNLSIKAYVRASVYESCLNLNVKILSVLLLHRACHLSQRNGVVWKELLELKEQGLIKELGVSVQSEEELELALQYESITFVQMPYNLLDHRWKNVIDKIKRVKIKRKLTVHIRGSLLQGLLLSDDCKLWERANIDNPNEVIKYLIHMVKETRCESILELCITYVRSLNWADGIVIGMETVAQLEENLKLFSKPIFSLETLKSIDKNRPILSEKTLNPCNWSN